MLILLPFLACGLPLLILNWSVQQEAKNKLIQEAYENGIYNSLTSTAVYSGECPYFDKYTGVLVQCTSTPTQVVEVLLPTVTPTLQPTDTPTPSPFEHREFTKDLYLFRLSFYDPNIGYFFPDKAIINCGAWDFVSRTCKGRVLLNQGDFHDWYGKGIACPPALPDLSLVRVVFPRELAGDWVCVDRGGAIVDNWLDFLLRYPDQVWTGANLNNFPWGSEVHAYIALPQ